MREEWQEERRRSGRCGIKAQRKGGRCIKNEIGRGHKKTEKKRKDTVNIHRRTQGGRSPNIPLRIQNPGNLSHLGFSFYHILKCVNRIRTLDFPYKTRATFRFL